jgi:hypothetical protein
MTTALIRPSLRPHPLRATLSPGFAADVLDAPTGNDLRLFLTAWLGGLVFFGTLLA